MLLVVLVVTALLLPHGVGKMKSKPKFTQVFSNTPAINWLSAARLFLFGSRDVWFVVGLPVFLYSVLGWSFMEVGGFIALWVIGYGMVQASAPRLIRRSHHGRGPGGGTARLWAFVLAVFPAAMALALQYGLDPTLVIVTGLVLFGVVFAINSAVHSYLILAYSDFDKVSMNVGFYYMANAGGRLAGTVLSGLVYQTQGLTGCLWWSAGFVLAAALLSFKLPEAEPPG
jgi:predicted MFS family arabinose efflux permease